MSSQSVGANCEDDNYANLTNFKKLLFITNISSPSKALSSSYSEINFPDNIHISKKNSKLALACQAYVAGAITKKSKKLQTTVNFALTFLIRKILDIVK